MTKASATTASSQKTDASQRLITIPDFSDGHLVTGARTIRVYLPEDYNRTKKRYRVLYFHDGQDVFYTQSTRSGDACARVNIVYDQLVKINRIYPAILVAVDSGPNNGRKQELTPSRDAGEETGGLIAAYYQFLVTRVKSYIDGHFRTLSDAKHTGIAGCSLGGLASFYLAYKHPETFGFAGCMSSSLWWDKQKLLKQVQADSRPHTDVRFWFDCGIGEGEDMWQPAVRAVQSLEKKGWHEGDDVALFLDYNGLHNQSSWASRMPFMLQFLLGKQRPKLAGAVIRSVANPSSEPIRLMDVVENSYATLELQYEDGFRLNAASPQFSIEGSGVAQVNSGEWGRLTNKGSGIAVLCAQWQGERPVSAFQTLIGFGTDDLPRYERLACPDLTSSQPLINWSKVAFIAPAAANGWRFAVARDTERNLHLRVEVIADKIRADANKNPWQQDGIEARLDASPDPLRCKGNGQGESERFLLLAASPSTAKPNVYQAEDLPHGVVVRCEPIATGYFLEATVPAQWLDEQQQEPWKEFRLNVCINRPNTDGAEVLKQWWQPDWRSPGNTVGSGTFRVKP